MILKKIKIKDIGNIVTGKTPPTKSKEYYGDDYVFIKPTYIDMNSRYFENIVERVSEEAFKKYKNSFVPKNSICVVTIGSIGEKMCLTKELCITNQAINTVVPNLEEYDPVFIYYLLKYNLYKVKSMNNGTSSGRENVNKTTFENIEVDVPDLTVQRKISNILSKYDDLIENNIKRIKLLEEAIKIIYNEYFINFNFHGSEKLSFINGLPCGWSKKSVLESEYFSLIKDNIKRFDDVKKYFATADIEGIEFVSEGEKINWEKKPSRAQKQPILNSVWVARMKDAYKVLGFTSINEDIAKESVLSSGFVGFLAKDELCFALLFSLIKSEGFLMQRDNFATGSTQISLNNDGLRYIEYIEPSIEIIEYYGKIVLPMINKIFTLQRYNRQLKEARDILLPKFIRGEIEV